MKGIEHQTQSDPNGCVFACMAMLSFGEWSQDKIRLAMDDETSLRAEFLQLTRMGLWGEFCFDSCLRIDAVQLLTVPSLNNLGGNHRVIVDTRNDERLLFDPNHGYHGRKWYRFDDLRSWSEVVVVHDAFDRDRI